MESARASPVKLGTFTSPNIFTQTTLTLLTLEYLVTSVHSKQQSTFKGYKAFFVNISALFALCFAIKRAKKPYL